MKSARILGLALLALSAPSTAVADTAMDRVLENKLRVIQHMALNPTVVRAVRRQNATAGSPETRKARESEWGSEGMQTPLRRALEETPAGQFLKGQVERDPVITQAVVTDATGDNVAVYPAVGPYFHGDELAWREAYGEGAGKVFTGPLTRDDASGAHTVQIAAPVVDQGRTIGVLVVAATVTPTGD
jgi:hypothetical protein